MRLHRDCVAAILLIVVIAAPSIVHADSLSVRAGVGYDFLSQEYFLDTAQLFDTLEATVDLKSDYLDDFKGILRLAWLPLDNRNLELRSTLEQSADDFRMRLDGDIRTKSSKLDFLLSSEFDWREHIGDSADAGDGYVFGSTRARLKTKVNEMTSLWLETKADFVTFEEVSAYSQSYYRVGGKLGLMRSFESLSSLDLNLFYLARKVPDSTALDYSSAGVEGSFFGFYSLGTLDVYARLELKDYNRPAEEMDYTRFEVDGRHQVRISQSLFLRQELDVDMTRFVAPDVVNLDYSRIGLVLLGGAELADFTFAIGPDLELLTEKDADNLPGQDYFETAFRADLDYLNPGVVFGSIESVTGFRNLEKESSLQSDFSFERVNLIADWTLLGNLNLNILLSAEWEWHENRAENNRILLLSSSLSYSF